MKNDKLKSRYRVNEQIHVREVRVVGDNIASTVMPTHQAIALAQRENLDLVEISPNANPPVCRLIDYSKFLYQQKKHQKEMKAKQVKIDVKEIRFGPQTDDHDYNFKLKHAKEFLSDGNKVKAYVFFKGRSILFKEQGGFASTFRQRFGRIRKSGTNACVGRKANDFVHCSKKNNQEQFRKQTTGRSFCKRRKESPEIKCPEGIQTSHD